MPTGGSVSLSSHHRATRSKVMFTVSVKILNLHSRTKGLFLLDRVLLGLWEVSDVFSYLCCTVLVKFISTLPSLLLL